MKNTHVTIRATLAEIREGSYEDVTLTGFLREKAQDAVNKLHDAYGSGDTPQVSIVDYQIVGHEDNQVLINVEYES